MQISTSAREIIWLVLCYNHRAVIATSHDLLLRATGEVLHWLATVHQEVQVMCLLTSKEVVVQMMVGTYAAGLQLCHYLLHKRRMRYLGHLITKATLHKTTASLWLLSLSSPQCVNLAHYFQRQGAATLYLHHHLLGHSFNPHHKRDRVTLTISEDQGRQDHLDHLDSTGIVDETKNLKP